MITKRFAWLGLLGLCFLITSCEQKETKFRVSGTVFCDGKPVPMGSIYFDPDPTKGGTGTQGHADIRDGKFDTNAPGCSGVKAGAYIVRVLGYDGKVANESPYGQPLFLEQTSSKTFEAKDNELQFDYPGLKKK
ncbi:MAG: hypothetical protein ACRC8S_03325 [Fimbriiglobus sp.]